MRNSTHQPHRNQTGAADRIAALIQPRPFSDPHSDTTQAASADFSHVDLFSHAPQRSPIQRRWAVSEANELPEPEAQLARETAWSLAPPTPPLVQRQSAPPAIQRKKENEAPLSQIQGLPMYALLPKLLTLPSEVLSDEAAGGFVGGPRLVTAMRTVKAKGTAWLDFATAHNGELAALPTDQIGDIIRFLGAPQEARYFKADQFDGRFDGAVDPAKALVTLFFRVKFQVAEGARFGAAAAGTPAWEKETQAGLQQFKADFKRVVEESWSNKGTVQPACPIGAIRSFQTKVVVTVVESGEHKLIHIFSDSAEGRSNMGAEGNLQVSDNQAKNETKQVTDPTGRHPEQVTNKQIPAAHEFGHAIGLKHPHCPGGDDNCYGVTAEERRDIMGAGDKVQVIKRNGKVIHDDFMAFERIAERWGKDVLPGALAKCNQWSAG